MRQAHLAMGIFIESQYSEQAMNVVLWWFIYFHLRPSIAKEMYIFDLSLSYRADKEISSSGFSSSYHSMPAATSSLVCLNLRHFAI